MTADPNREEEKAEQAATKRGHWTTPEDRLLFIEGYLASAKEAALTIEAAGKLLSRSRQEADECVRRGNWDMHNLDLCDEINAFLSLRGKG